MDSSTMKGLTTVEHTRICHSEILSFLDKIAPFERLILGAVKDDCALHNLTQIPKHGRLLIADVLATLNEKTLCEAITHIYYDQEQLNLLLLCAPHEYSEFRNAIKRLLFLSQVERPPETSNFRTCLHECWHSFRLILIITFTINILLAFFTTFIAKIGFEGSTFFIHWKNTDLISNAVLLMAMSAATTWLVKHKG